MPAQPERFPLPRFACDCLLLVISFLALDLGSRTAHCLRDFLLRNHGRVARCCHCQRSTRGAACIRPLRCLSAQKSVNQSGGERIAAAAPVKDFKILSRLRLRETAALPANGSLIVDGGGLRLARNGGDDLKRTASDSQLKLLIPAAALGSTIESRAERSNRPGRQSGKSACSCVSPVRGSPST